MSMFMRTSCSQGSDLSRSPTALCSGSVPFRCGRPPPFTSAQRAPHSRSGVATILSGAPQSALQLVASSGLWGRQRLFRRAPAQPPALIVSVAPPLSDQSPESLSASASVRPLPRHSDSEPFPSQWEPPRGGRLRRSQEVAPMTDGAFNWKRRPE